MWKYCCSTAVTLGQDKWLVSYFISGAESVSTQCGGGGSYPSSIVRLEISLNFYFPFNFMSVWETLFQSGAANS